MTRPPRPSGKDSSSQLLLSSCIHSSSLGPGIPFPITRSQCPGAAHFAPQSASWVASTDGCCTRAALVSSRSFRFSCLQTEPRHCDPHIRPKGSRLTALHAWRPCASATSLRLDLCNVPPHDWARLRWLSRTRPFLWLVLNIPLHLLASRRSLFYTLLRARRSLMCLNPPIAVPRAQQSAQPGWRIAVGTLQTMARWS